MGQLFSATVVDPRARQHTGLGHIRLTAPWRRRNRTEGAAVPPRVLGELVEQPLMGSTQRRVHRQIEIGLAHRLKRVRPPGMDTLALLVGVHGLGQETQQETRCGDRPDVTSVADIRRTPIETAAHQVDGTARARIRIGQKALEILAPILRHVRGHDQHERVGKALAAAAEVVAASGFESVIPVEQRAHRRRLRRIALAEHRHPAQLARAQQRREEQIAVLAGVRVRRGNDQLRRVDAEDRTIDVERLGEHAAPA